MHAPRALLFDLGGTLLHQQTFRPEAWADALAALVPDAGVGLDAARAAVRELDRDFRRLSKTGLVEVRMAACLRHLHDRLGVEVPLPPAEIELAFWRATSRMVPEPGVAAALAWLAGRDLPLGVVSNSMFGAEVLRWELARHGLDGAFRFILSSADYGLRKPHPSLFRTAVAKLRLAPEEVWFIGDNVANDVVGARGAGLVPIWYARRRGVSAGAAEARLGHWDELAGLF